MAEIDGLLANMVRRGAERVLLESDQPMRVFSSSGEAQGATLAAAQLQALLREILPAQLRPRLLQEGRYQFAHRTSQGAFEVRVARREARLQVEIVMQPGGNPKPDGQPEAEEARAEAGSGTDSGAGQALRDWAPRLMPQPQGHEGSVLQVALAPHGEVVASAGEDGAVYTWSIEAGKRLHTLRPQASGAGSPLHPTASQAFCVAFSPDGRLIAAGAPGTLQAWDARSGISQLKNSLARHNVRGVAFAPGSSVLAYGSSAAGLGAPPGAQGRAELWDVPRKKVARTYSPRQEALAVAFSSDGKWLAIGDARGVGLCDLGLKPNALSSLQQSLGRGARASDYTHAVALDAPAVSLSFSSRGSGLAVCTGGQCVLLDAATQRVLWKQRQKGMRAVAFAPGGSTIAAANEDGQLYFFSWASGAPCHPPLRAGPSEAQTLAFSADGRTLACGCSDGSLQLWRLF